MTAAFRRLASSAPPPVFVVVGAHGRRTAQRLRLDPRVHVVPAPRHADVLLSLGGLDGPLREATISAHDVMPPPRAMIEWRADQFDAPVESVVPGGVVVHDADPVPRLVEIHRALIEGHQSSTSAVRPDIDPAPWRGIGPYGQGGAGMTGGVPYGRPMAEREEDRDGLTLDALPVLVGPLFSAFPEALSARITFKGDLVHRFELGPDPFGARPAPGAPEPFARALSERVAIHELEIARARALLAAASHALRVLGLHALSQRALRIAADAGPAQVREVHRLRRVVTNPAVTGWQTRRVGVIDTADLIGSGLGPVTRAGGLAEDIRNDDASYAQLGFRPIVGGVSDARGRLVQWLSEAEQALDLARRAGGRQTGGEGVIESPRGRLEPGSSPTDRLLARVPQLVTGLEWGDAVTTLNSLDLDLRETSRVLHDPVVAGP